MQEIAILLSSLAGACTAAAARKFPKGKHVVSTLGANTHIKNQINSLKLEKEILTKTIARLYQHESELSKTQKDRLLLKYQHQLGVVLAKIEKLEETSKHPDLGPLSEGLITLMDQKLSTLDKRLYELSSKINLVNEQTSPIKHEPQIPEKRTKESELKPQPKMEVSQTKLPDQFLPKPHRPFEITTLTEVPEKIPESFFKAQVIIPQIKDDFVKPQKEQVELVQHASVVPQVEQPKIEQSQEQSSPPPPVVKKPAPKIVLPEDDKEEDDEDDLDKIKGEIMKTLSKLEQAEVE
jgi:myosin heavy subunit